MITQDTLLVTLGTLVGRIPVPPPPAKRGRGRPKPSPEHLFLQALVIMIVKHLHMVYALLSGLAQSTAAMQQLRQWLPSEGRFPTRRTWERRLAAMPDTLPAQIAWLGHTLVAMIQPWAACGRAAAIDSTVLRARGGGWHTKDREAGGVPHTSLDTEAHWTKSGWHGWGYGWKLHLVTSVAAVGMPLAADLTPANTADTEHALKFWRQRVERSGLTCFDGFLKLLDRWLDLIANSCIAHHTSGFVEGLNNKRKVLKRRCYGLRNVGRLFQRLWLDLDGYRRFSPWKQAHH